jgi:hypothetical protein
MHDDINKFANDNNTSNPQRICVFGMIFLLFQFYPLKTANY